MTEEDKKSLMATTSDDAANDICSFVEDMIGVPLSENQKRNLQLKAKYWFLIGTQKQHLIITEQFNKLRKELSFDGHNFF